MNLRQCRKSFNKNQGPRVRAQVDGCEYSGEGERTDRGIAVRKDGGSGGSHDRRRREICHQPGVDVGSVNRRRGGESVAGEGGRHEAMSG